MPIMLGEQAARDHAIADGYPLGREILRPDDGTDLIRANVFKGVIPAGAGCFYRIAKMPPTAVQQIPHFVNRSLVCSLERDPALADHLA